MFKRLQSILETSWSLLLVYSGLWFLLRALKRPTILVLAYHRVTPDDEAPRWFYPERCVTTSTFERQLEVLKRHYDCVSLEDLDAILAGERPLRRPVALVTFDDGYRDLYEEAWPVLQRLDIPALCFLSLGFVEGKRSFWFDRLALGLETWDRDAERRARLRPLLPEALAAAFEARAPRRERLQRAVAFLLRLPMRDRRALMKRLLPELLPQRGEPVGEALTWSQVRELRAGGIAIGAHGCSHTQLTRLSPEEIWREVQDSLHGVAQGCGTAVEAFAYPHGGVDDEVRRTVDQAGVRAAFTLEPRENRPGDDPLRLGRRNVCEESSRALGGHFSAARFLCDIGGFLPKPAGVGKGRLRNGAARLELSWTGPQEASARLESHAVALLGREIQGVAPAPSKRRSRSTEEQARR